MMTVSKNRKHWRTLVGALAVAGLALGLSLRLEGAAHVPGGISRQLDQKVAITAEEAERAVRSAQSQRQAAIGEPVTYGNIADLMSGNVPTFPTIVVDYRDDDATRMRDAGLLVGPLPSTTHQGGEGGVAMGGCSFAIDCDDGNRCTSDSCDFTPGQPAGSGTCVNVPGDSNVGNAQCPGNFGLACGGCDDGLFCNGVETCSGGSCVAGTPPCPGVCSESFDLCQDLACSAAADCSNAGVVGAELAAVAALHCNGTETCASGVCVAGSNLCGSGAVCGEKRCSFAGNPNLSLVNNVFCITNEDCAEFTGSTCTVVGPACKEGRCCTGSTEPTCARRAKFAGRCTNVGGGNSQAPCINNSQCSTNNCNTTSGVGQSCDSAGGVFYGHDGGTIPSGGGTVCPADVGGVAVKCPKYGSGIAPSGPFTQLGPISDSPVVVAPFGVPLQKLGDDYTLSNDSASTFIALDFLRFAGGSPSTNRISFEIFDESGNFIEDLFFIGTAAFGIYPVRFDPPLTIPGKGYIVMSVASSFSPDARHVWASTNGVDIGTNDAGVLWVNNGPAGNFGTSGVLAFELEGNKVAGDFGACCYTNPDICTNSITPYACRGDGGIYLGHASICASCDSGPNTGAYCRRCSNNTALACNQDSDCGGGNTCIPFDGACSGGICVAEPACNEGGCCNPTTGACTVETEASCTGGGRNYLGNGSDCDADHGYDDAEQHCCPQPLSSWSGADDCADVTLHVISAPPIGEISVVTISGNNSNATNIPGPNQDSCFDPSDDPNAEPGWWEGFTLVDDCTVIYIDHCCTNPVHRPAYSIIYDSCPCGSAIFSKPNPYKFPEPGFSRGIPYCADDDNLWQSFGLMGPGTYYYPIYSALAGNIGDYQLHISAHACPTAACCSADQCVDDVTQFECDALGGFFLAPPNRSPAITTCSGTNGQPGSTCYDGSCCTGPGECFDFQLGTTVQKADCDTALGNFIGGVRCAGGSCSDQPLQSCSVNADCNNNNCVGDTEQLSQNSPCPICEIEGVGNCQAYDDTLNFTLSDRAIGDNGLMSADDIIPDGDTLSQVCVWGFYLDSDPNSPVDDCGPEVTSDSFRVRVYNNDPATGRSPGTLFGESMATSEKGVISPSIVETRLNIQQYGYQLTLNTPITGLTIGGTYWLEVSNDVSESVDQCLWFWTGRTPDSNAFSFAGTDDGYGFEAPSENVFCTNFTFSDLGAQPGSCCTCDGNCAIRTLTDCANANGIWELTATDCVGAVCPNGPPANDDCADSIEIVAGQYDVHNQCATTDGFGPIVGDVGSSQIDFDVWYTFIAPSSCELEVSECQTGFAFDSMLAVYYNPDNPTVCPPCPLDATLSAAHLAGEGQDESCDGALDGGPGVWVSTDQIKRNALAGECFLLRIGSFPGSRGSAILNVSCGEGGGDTPPAVVPNSNASCLGPANPHACCTAAGAGVCDKSRFISFTPPGDSSSETAIRIKLDTLHNVSPGYSNGPTVPFTAFQGQSVWVGPPVQYLESSGSGIPFKASYTQCTPHYQDWSTVGLLHVTGSAIVPSSNYTVEHLGNACQGSEGSCADFETGAAVRTTRWGDVAANFNPPALTAQPDLADIGSMVNKFRDAPGAPIKVRVTIATSSPFGVIATATLTQDFNFSHVAACVSAFAGNPYPYRMGKCATTVTGSGACTTGSDCTGSNAPPCNLFCP